MMILIMHPLYLFRVITQSVIESFPDEPFKPFYATPTIYRDVISKLAERAGNLDLAREILYRDLAKDFGSEIAEETFRYAQEALEIRKSLEAMWNSGMEDQVARFMSRSNVVDGNTLDEKISNLVNDINADIENKNSNQEDEEGNVPLDDIWNI